MLLLLGMMGCQAEVLRVMGALTGVSPDARAVVVTTAPPPMAPPPVATAEVAAASVGSVGAVPLIEGGEPPPAPAAGEATRPGDYNPISMPQGPRDSPGV